MPELNFSALNPARDRCECPCGRRHSGQSILYREGVKRVVTSGWCAECAQKRLDSGRLTWRAMFESGEPVG